MNTHDIHKGDTGTPIDFTVGDRNGPWDLTGATVLFRYAVNGVVTEKSVTPDPDQTANRGRATAYWGASELSSVAAGSYPCQAKVTFSDGKVRYAPQRKHNVLNVISPL